MITKVTHITLFVLNQDEVLAFYTEKLGFKVHTDAQFGPMRWLTICAEHQHDFEIVLMLAESAAEKSLVGKQGALKPFINVETSDCLADYEKLKALGVEFFGEPEKQPWGIGVAFKDVCGNTLYMCQPV